MHVIVFALVDANFRCLQNFIIKIDHVNSKNEHKYLCVPICVITAFLNNKISSNLCKEKCLKRHYYFVPHTTIIHR